jgi:hypothetical protein
VFRNAAGWGEANLRPGPVIINEAKKEENLSLAVRIQAKSTVFVNVCET